MLRIVAVAYEVVRELRPFLESLKRMDANLEDQLRRALQSMAQNTSEGCPQIGKRRALHYSYALGFFNHTIGTLTIILHGKRVERAA